jgi:hypothetical protein
LFSDQVDKGLTRKEFDLLIKKGGKSRPSVFEVLYRFILIFDREPDAYEPFVPELV